MSSYCSKRPPALSTDYVSNQRYPGFGWPVVYEGTHMKEVLWWRVFEGYVTQNFHSIKRSQLPVQQFTAGAYVLKDKGGSVSKNVSRYDGYFPPTYTRYSTATRTGSTEYLCGTAKYAITNLQPSLVQESALTIARNKALSQCGNMKINLAQSFGERRQTANLLVNNVNRFVSFALLARKGRFSEANKLLRGRPKLLTARSPAGIERRFQRDTLKMPSQVEFSSLWLEYSYGWRPLLSDIYGAAELLAQTATKTRPMSAFGKGKAQEDRKWLVEGQYDAASIFAKYESTVKLKYEFDIEDTLADVLKSTGITDPALLAWELLPYSFVVDWFLPVGTYLKNWNAASGLKFLKGFQSTKYKVYACSTPTRCYDDFPVAGSGYIEGYLVSLRREPVYEFPLPTLPTFSMDLNWKQIASATALLSQIFQNPKSRAPSRLKRKQELVKFDKNITGRVTDRYDWKGER